MYANANSKAGSGGFPGVPGVIKSPKRLDKILHPRVGEGCF